MWLAVLLVPHIVAIFQGKVQSPGVDVSGASGSYLPQFLFYSSFTVATNPEYPTMYASTVRFHLRLYLGCLYTSGRCLTRLTLLPPPQVLFYLLFYIFFSMRYDVNQRRAWVTPQIPHPTPHIPLYRYYVNQRRATFYADTFESETKSMKHARLLFTS